MWGKIRQDFRKFLPKQSMQNILYVIILTLTLLVAVFVGFFVSKSQQEKQAQIIVQDNQELAEQINVSMSQYLHSMTATKIMWRAFPCFRRMGHFCRSCRHCHLPLPQMLCRKNGFPVHLSEVRIFIFLDRRYKTALNITAVFRG